MNFKGLISIIFMLVLSINAQDYFAGEIWLVIEKDQEKVPFVLIRQKSAVIDGDQIPQLIMFRVNIPAIKAIIPQLIDGDGFSGSRIMLTGGSLDDKNYQVNEIVNALCILTRSALRFEPMRTKGENKALILTFSPEDLMALYSLCENVDQNVRYELDISDPAILSDFSQLLLKNFIHDDGELKLRSLKNLLELLFVVREQFSDNISVEPESETFSSIF